MRIEDFGLGWIDFLIVGLLIAGVVRGRKRGMSEELLDVIKWIVIVGAAAWGYEPMGALLSGSTMFSNLSSYVAMYTGVVFILMLLFSFVRSQIGGKIIGSDVFGGAEYYLGMCAGLVRYTCIIIVAMALLNARYYSPVEIKEAIKYQEDNFGSIYFPTLCTMQNQVFAQSLTGRLTRDYLAMLLIKPTAPEEKGLGEAGIVRSRERTVYDVLDKK